MPSDINFFSKEGSLLFKEINSKRELTSSERLDGYFINSNEDEARKIIEFLKNAKEKKKVAIKSKDEQFNRRILETLNFDYIVSPEFNLGKDNLKQRSSGLNHFLVKLAREKNIAIVISLDSLFSLNKKDKARIISRIIQNVKISRKAKCLFKIASFSKQKIFSERERKLIGFSWGMSSQQIKHSCIF